MIGGSLPAVVMMAKDNVSAWRVFLAPSVTNVMMDSMASQIANVSYILIMIINQFHNRAQ